VRYPEVVQRENIKWCAGCEIGNHQKGWANPSRTTVHWSDRNVNRYGLRRFLMLVANVKHHHNRGQPRWQALYEQNQYAYRRALDEYHVRLASTMSQGDRARVRYWMGRAGVLNDPDKQNIARWAMERK